MRNKRLHKVTSEENVHFFLTNYPNVKTLSERINLPSTKDQEDEPLPLIDPTPETHDSPGYPDEEDVVEEKEGNDGGVMDAEEVDDYGYFPIDIAETLGESFKVWSEQSL